jgi:hypothetical protein
MYFVQVFRERGRLVETMSQNQILYKKANEYFGALIEIDTQLSLNYKDSADKSLQFIYQIITLVSVIAGFGFTAIEHVNRKFFLVGEAGLFLCIVVSLCVINIFWVSGLKSTEEFRAKHFKMRQDLKKAMLDHNEEKIKEIIKELENSPGPGKGVSNIFYWMSWAIISIITISSIFLLLSFIIS